MNWKERALCAFALLFGIAGMIIGWAMTAQGNAAIVTVLAGL